MCFLVPALPSPASSCRGPGPRVLLFTLLLLLLAAARTKDQEPNCCTALPPPQGHRDPTCVKCMHSASCEQARVPSFLWPALVGRQALGGTLSGTLSGPLAGRKGARGAKLWNDVDPSAALLSPLLCARKYPVFTHLSETAQGFYTAGARIAKARKPRCCPWPRLPCLRCEMHIFSCCVIVLHRGAAPRYATVRLHGTERAAASSTHVPYDLSRLPEYHRALHCCM